MAIGANVVSDRGKSMSGKTRAVDVDSVAGGEDCGVGVGTKSGVG